MVIRPLSEVGQLGIPTPFGNRMTRTNRSLLALASGAGGSTFTLLLALLATPVLLRLLGDERVGTHRVALEWLGYLALLDFGLGGALQAAVARRLGRGERDAALADVRNAMRLFARVAVVQLAALAAFAGLAGWVVRGLTPEMLAELRWGLLVGAVGLLLAPLAALRPLLDGSQRSYWVNLALLFQSVGTTAFAVLFAWLGWGLVGQFAAALVGSSVLNLVLLVVVSRTYPNLWGRRLESRPDPLPAAWSMFAFNLVGRFSVLSDGIILGAILGPAEVVRFVLTQRLMLVAVGQVQGIGNATWAALAELHHAGDHDAFRRRFLQLNRWTAILVVAGLGPLVILNERLVSLWVGAPRFAGDTLTWLTAAQGALLAQIGLWAWPLVGCGFVRATLPVMLIGSGINLLVSVTATHEFGLIGPAVGTATGYLLVYYGWYPRLLDRKFGLRPLAVMKDLPLAILVFLPVGAILRVCTDGVTEGLMSSRVLDFVIWTATAGVTGLIYLVIAWRVLTPTEERSALARRVWGRA